mmetsp:Transcript_32852/g.83145  ORF Transcript_32852/g.83145 Transcript_32852/m.83145 type:complete len:209 (-) Transcript_32852:279-905(-)
MLHPDNLAAQQPATFGILGASLSRRRPAPVPLMFGSDSAAVTGDDTLTLAPTTPMKSPSTPSLHPSRSTASLATTLTRSSSSDRTLSPASPSVRTFTFSMTPGAGRLNIFRRRSTSSTREPKKTPVSALRQDAASAAGQAMRRRVYFCPTPLNSSHAVTPYATKYGQHPRLFDFNRRGEMQLNAAGIMEEMRIQERKELLESVEDVPD